MVLRDIFRTKKNGKGTGEAAKAKTTSGTADKALDDIPFGLDVWVEGVDPIVEYISLDALNSIIAANSGTWL